MYAMSILIGQLKVSITELQMAYMNTKRQSRLGCEVSDLLLVVSSIELKVNIESLAAGSVIHITSAAMGDWSYSSQMGE